MDCKHILIVHTATDPKPYALDLVSLGYRFSLVKKRPVESDYAYFDRVLDVCYEDDVAGALSQVRQLHKQDPIDGVLSFSESGVLMASFIARDLGLPGNAPPAALRARNKYLMRQAICDAGLAAPDFHLVHTADDIFAHVQKAGHPMVLKPISGSSSYGVIRISPEDSLEEIDAHLTSVQTYIRSYRVENPQYPFEFWLPGAGVGIAEEDVMDPAADFLLEGFIGGQQVSVDGIVSNGQISCLGVIEIERIKDEDYFLEYEEWMPTRFGPEHEAKIQRAVTQAVAALGLTHCCFHCELKVDADAIVVLEIAARRGADNISDFLKRVMGVNIYEEGVRIATGEPRSYCNLPYLGCMKMRYFLPETSGTLIGVIDTDMVMADSRVSELVFEFEPGDEVLAPPKGYEFLGYLSVFEETPEMADAALEALYRQIRFVIEPTSKFALGTAQ